MYILALKRERCMGRGKQQRTHADFVTKLSGQRFQRKRLFLNRKRKGKGEREREEFNSKWVRVRGASLFSLVNESVFIFISHKKDEREEERERERELLVIFVSLVIWKG